MCYSIQLQISVSDFLSELSEVQRDAVINFKGPALIIAGAGSGKTRVLTYRIAWLIEQGVAPQSILALTFTNKAAREMRERIATLVGEATAKRLWMGTFHSVFARILRQESKRLGYPSTFTIYDTQDSRNVIKQISKYYQLDDTIYKPNEVFGRISQAKNNLITPAAYASNTQVQAQDKASGKPMMAQIFSDYATRCFKAGAMDFDDILILTNVLFRDHPEALDKYRHFFRYILVDEYQDTNYAQYLIVKKLGEFHRNVCVVGDDAQSIYAFRGAKIENILNFRNDYPDYKVYKLEENYRSTQTIVNAANSVIEKNVRQIKKKVFSQNEVGDPILVLKTGSDHEEGHVVANMVQDLKYAKRLHNSDFAILYRTNAQSRILEEAFRKRNIPYKVYGGLSFYQRKEIKDTLAYLRLLVNQKDNEAFKRIINYPARGIGDTTLIRLEEASEAHGGSLWEVSEHLQELAPSVGTAARTKIAGFLQLMQGFMAKREYTDTYELVYEITAATGLIQDLKSDKTPEGISRIENVEALLNGVKEYVLARKEEEEPATLESFLESIALLTDDDPDKSEERDKVSLMTIHASKGLEFNTIFITGLEELLFPGQQSLVSPGDLEEERRLFYVALTRGKARVVLSYAESRYKWGSPTLCSPSRFLQDIDEAYLEAMEFSPSARPAESREASPFERANRQSAGFGSPREGTSRQGPARPAPARQPTGFRSHATPSAGETSKESFAASSPEQIQEGMTVEHQRFGTGKVIGIEGSWPDSKATVLFGTSDRKQLLLKFAKLKIIE